MKKRLATTAAGFAALAAVLGTAGPSAAASGGSGGSGPRLIGSVEVCAGGNYAVSVKFPDRDGMETYLAAQGKPCVSTTLSGGFGGSDGYEPFEVIGRYNTTGARFQIGGTHWFSATTEAVSVTAKGTTTSPSADVTFYF